MIVADSLGVWLRSNWIVGVGGAPVRVIGTGIDCDMTAWEDVAEEPDDGWVLGMLAQLGDWEHWYKNRLGV